MTPERLSALKAHILAGGEVRNGTALELVEALERLRRQAGLNLDAETTAPEPAREPAPGAGAGGNEAGSEGSYLVGWRAK